MSKYKQFYEAALVKEAEWQSGLPLIWTYLTSTIPNTVRVSYFCQKKALKMYPSLICLGSSHSLWQMSNVCWMKLGDGTCLSMCSSPDCGLWKGSSVELQPPACSSVIAWDSGGGKSLTCSESNTTPASGAHRNDEPHLKFRETTVTEFN